MNLVAHDHRRRIGAVAALMTAAGLIVAACSTSSPGSSGSSLGTGTGSGSGSGNGSGSGGSTSVVSSNSVPFPVAVGNTWVYKTSTLTGSADNRRTDKIIAVKPVSGGTDVTMSSTDNILGTTSTSQSEFVFHSDGSISYPFNQFNTGGAQSHVKLISGGLLWPSAAVLASGKQYHDLLRIQTDVAGHKLTLTSQVTVQGGGTQTVTVPAGTYNATVVKMTMSETVAGFHATTEITTWLASGVGPVKTEVTIKEAGISRVTAEDQLVSFTK
ncbi:MAG TPA: hypothetical protein VGI66_01265 [Streptosporangiaceae bacterium]